MVVATKQDYINNSAKYMHSLITKQWGLGIFRIALYYAQKP